MSLESVTLFGNLIDIIVPDRSYKSHQIILLESGAKHSILPKKVVHHNCLCRIELTVQFAKK
ncbi:hypothetical protein M758_4G116200 [Ceratodon purpureus]|nr:hypothetical protein M758_4G116200 [Ceratodon purpureus]